MPAKYCVPKARNTKRETNPTGARRPMSVATRSRAPVIRPMISEVCGVSFPLAQPEVLVLRLHDVDEHTGEDGQARGGEADPPLAVVEPLDDPLDGAG